MKIKSETFLSGLALLALSHGFGAVSIILWAAFLFRGPLNLFDLHLGETGSLCVDALLSLMFFIQHSVMLRTSFKQRFARFVREAYHSALYAAASGIALTVVVVFWQGPVIPCVSLQDTPRLLMRLVFVLSIAGFVWGVKSLGAFDTFGREPVLRAMRNEKMPAPLPLAVRGPYRWVRHPLYLSCLLMIWTGPEITADRLLYNLLWSGWIVLGAVLEERDLVALFGQAYRDYQKTVPMLLPTSFRPFPAISDTGTTAARAAGNGEVCG